MTFNPNAEAVYQDLPGDPVTTPSKAEVRSLLNQYETAISTLENASIATFVITGDGATKIFAMPIAAATPQSVLGVFDGVVQDPSSYTVSGNTLTFLSAPPAGVTGTWRVLIAQGVETGVPDASISDAKVQPGTKLFNRNRDFVLATDLIPLSSFDGVTDASAELQQLLNLGKKVLIPATSEALYLGNATLDFSAGGSLAGMDGKPAKLKTDASVFFNINGLSGVHLLENLSIEGRNQSTSYNFRLTNCRNLRISNVDFFNIDSGFDIVGCEDLVFDQIGMHEYRGTGFKLRSGTNNVVFYSPRFRNGGSFSIYGDNGDAYGDPGASNVTIYDIRRTYDPAHLDAVKHAYLIGKSNTVEGWLGIEAVGARYKSINWQVFGGFIENVNENSISLSGFRCIVQGVRIHNGRINGIQLYGRFSKAIGNEVYGCDVGIGTSANAGGIGCDHVIANNQIHSCGLAGIRIDGSQYAVWSSAAEFEGNYCTYNDGTTIRIYEKISGGAKFGTIVPTHTSGDASDGINIFRFTSSVPSTQTLDTQGHIVTGNRLRNAPLLTTGLSAAAKAASIINNNLET